MKQKKRGKKLIRSTLKFKSKEKWPRSKIHLNRPKETLSFKRSGGQQEVITNQFKEPQSQVGTICQTSQFLCTKKQKSS